MSFINRCKVHAKWMKKYDNPDNHDIKQYCVEFALM